MSARRTRSGTVRPDGRPHVTPLIAVWHDDAIWFTTGPEERKARNLAVLEGRAEAVTDPERLQAVADGFTAKYGIATWHFVVREGAFSHAETGGRALVFCVRPVQGLGFRKGEHPSQTTWTFPS